MDRSTTEFKRSSEQLYFLSKHLLLQKPIIFTFNQTKCYSLSYIRHKIHSTQDTDTDQVQVNYEF